MRKLGAMPDHMLRRFLTCGYINGASPDNVQPASLDLTMSDEVLQIDSIMLPRHDMFVTQLKNVLGGIRVRKNMGRRRRRSTKGFHLAKGVPYLVRLQEFLELPPDIYGFTNPKSTTGRLDIHVRLVVDKTPRFDSVGRNYGGKLWALVVSRSFDIQVCEGTKLMQLRLFNGDTRIGQTELEIEMKSNPILWSRLGQPWDAGDISITDSDGSCLLTLDVESPVIGWRAKRNAPEVDLAAKGKLSVEKYFDRVVADHGVVAFAPNLFHIFSTSQYVRIPPHLACEMRPMDEKSGEFRAHYAGYIDPGWGWGKEGEGRGRPLTLEIRPTEPLRIGKGLPVAKIGFERLETPPETPYDAGTPTYSRQLGPQLARQFKPV